MEPTRLESVPLFEGLTAEELADCAAPFETMEVLSDHNISREGDHAYTLFIVLEGEVDVHRDFQKVATLGPGEFFGEMGVTTDAERNAHVTTRTRTSLAKLMAWDYKEMVRKHPIIGERVDSVIAERTASPEE